MGEEDMTNGIEIGGPALFYDMGGWIALVVYTILSFAGFFLPPVVSLGQRPRGFGRSYPSQPRPMLPRAPQWAEWFYWSFPSWQHFMFAVAALKIFGYVSLGLTAKPVSSRA